MPEFFRMPEVSANVTEAVVTSWNIDLGASYEAGDAIVTIETEKAVVDVEAETGGTLLRFLVKDGETAEVGAPIAIWGGPDESEQAVAAMVAALGAGGAPPLASPSPDAGVPTSPKPDIDAAGGDPSQVGPVPDRVFASPIARKMARGARLSLETIEGSGPQGRIRRRDVEAALARADSQLAAQSTPVDTATAPPASDASYTDQPNSRMRQAIARRLIESKQTAPHFYVRGSARVDRLLALREELNSGPGQRISVNDLVVKAVAVAHTRVPALNVQWRGEVTRHFGQADVAIAVATEAGLVTPVIRGVEGLSITEVARRARDLATRAAGRQLQQAEIEGGSITVTNLGMHGTEEFAAIINPPQAAILAVGAAAPQPVVVDGELAVGTVVHLCLAVDHRPVDGVIAARWMSALIDVLERPSQILA